MGKRTKRSGSGSILDAYRRIRKRMPPPERVIGDKRGKLDEDEARREIEEAERRERSSEEP